jgi:sulfate adenylyltransferase subunit 1 (EFTu-like GTPase family)/uncharacterized membrane protein
VQWVNRPNLDFRGFSGFISGGNIRPGDIVRILPSGRDTRVARIVTADGDLDSAVSGQSVTLTLAEEIDVSRGDLLCSPVSPATVGDRLVAKILWLVREPLITGKSYLLKLGTKVTPAAVTAVTARIEIETGLANPLGSDATLSFNEIAEARLTLETAVVCDLFAENRETGGFILIDRITNETVAVGMVSEAIPAVRREAFIGESYASMEGVPSRYVPNRKPVRSVVKALSWRVLGSVATFVAVFAMTKDASLALAVVAIEVAAKIALYYVHEEAWKRSSFGFVPSEPPADDAGL